MHVPVLTTDINVNKQVYFLKYIFLYPDIANFSYVCESVSEKY